MRGHRDLRYRRFDSTPRMKWLALPLLALWLTACGGSGSGGGSDGGGDSGAAVSGTIQSAAGADIDNDTNNPASSPIPNNTPGAQGLDNPVVLGGYVTRDRTTNPADNFFSAADPVDEYRVFLVQGQTLNLYIADHDPALVDLDLFIFDPNDPANPVQSAIGTGPTESITVTVPDGEYDVTIFAFKGGVNYILTIGNQTAAAGAGALSAETEFVPGEVLVRLRAEKSAAMARPLVGAGLQTLGMQLLSGRPGETQLLRLSDDAGVRQASLATLGVDLAALRVGKGAQGMTPRQRLRADTLYTIKALRAREDVETADPNYIRRKLFNPTDTHFGKQWHYPLVNLPQAWDITRGDTGVIVAVVDTGVFMTHPDLDGVLTATGFDFISNAVNARDGDGIDSNPDDPGDDPTPGLSSFHGTHVAGTVAAESEPDNIGIAGTSPNTRIMPLRVLGQNGGTSNDIIQAIRYAAGLSNASGITLSAAQRADVINLSLGGPGSSATEQAEYTNVRNQGVIIVAAAGNEATSAPSFPAAYDGVVSVSAVDFNKQLAPYSNFGSTIDIAAPGGNTGADANGDGFPDGVLSTIADDSSGTRQAAYGFYQGTSMASPHVAGIVGLMKDVYSGMTPDEFDQLLEAGLITEDCAGNGPGSRDNSFGYGVIDAAQAVQAALDLNNGDFPLTLSVAPCAANFGSVASSLDVVASQLGGDVGDTLSITGTSISAGDTWLMLTPPGTGDGLGTYTLSVDRAGLADGVYEAIVTFTTEDDNMLMGSEELQVTMRVGADPDPGDTGFTFVLLIDTETDEVVDQVGVANSNGLYQYRFEDVPPGSYEIVAGTDSDNDLFLCDEGESCGGYPTFALRESVVVSDVNVSGIDFTVNYAVGVGALQTGARTFRRGPPGDDHDGGLRRAR